MYAAGNRRVQELIDAGIPVTELPEHDIRNAMDIAFRLSDDRSSGHDADNRISSFIDELRDQIEAFGDFVPIEP